jgi:hypothetical protein
MFLLAGVDVEVRDSSGSTALTLAVHHGNFAVVSALLKGGSCGGSGGGGGEGKLEKRGGGEPLSLNPHSHRQSLSPHLHFHCCALDHGTTPLMACFAFEPNLTAEEQKRMLLLLLGGGARADI